MRELPVPDPPLAASGIVLQRIELLVDPENVASKRVAERCGFVEEGRLRSHWTMPDGRRVDSLVFGLIPEDLGELRPA